VIGDEPSATIQYARTSFHSGVLSRRATTQATAPVRLVAKNPLDALVFVRLSSW
jgi:hypothetical protein